MRLLPYGNGAVLVEPGDDGPDPLALAAAAAGIDGVRDVVPAARTVLVVADAPHRLDGICAELREVQVVAHPGGSRGVVELEVDYDGPDLAHVAADAGLEVGALVELHAATEYVVAFCGFVPGFAYLRGLDPALHLPRLSEPRTSVPAGSVGIAGEFTGVYPRASPGGWRLLGRTSATLWDLERDPPALLAPGTPVRFRAR